MKSKNIRIRKSLKIFGLILSIFVTSTGLKSQSISTVGEIYDYEIGDIFHIHYLEHYNGADQFYSTTNIEILNKYYSQNNDTLFYIRDIDYHEFYPSIYEYHNDTIFYSNLDSLINNGLIDEVYTDPDLYNGRLINSINQYIGWRKFAVGCGLTFFQEVYGSSGRNESNLVYYKKGDEEWGDQMLVSIYDTKSNDTELIVYPNPAKSTINILSSDVETIDLKIISMAGELVKAIKLRSELKTIDISQLRNGIYILEINKNDKVIYKKIIKE